MQERQSTTTARYRFLGITVDAFTSNDLLSHAAQAIRDGKRGLLFGNHNLHSLYLSAKDERLRQFYDRCRVTHIDGMSLVLLGKLLGAPLEREHRTTYLDWIEPFLKEIELYGWRLFIVGGSKDFASTLPRRLKERFPYLQVATHHGFFSSENQSALYREINQFAPHVLMVGMGMPRQEYWILNALPSLNANVVFNCGAAFEYLAGEKYRPPRWAGQMGLEWLFRMVSEPRRLAGRYLLEPFRLLPQLARAIIDPSLRSRRVPSLSSGSPSRDYKRPMVGLGPHKRASP
jgi:N-acetylglucosaminyldiphosphoundecaprenol N-acetyl-beta-D-mannosaminyltransferase